MIVHGRATNYRNGKCREDCCREPHRIQVAQNRADRLKAGRINHGSRSGYDAGCRCVECRAARSAAWNRESRKSVAARDGAAQPRQDGTGGPRVVSGYPRGGSGRLSRFRGKPVRDVSLPQDGGAA